MMANQLSHPARATSFNKMANTILDEEKVKSKIINKNMWRS